MGHLHVARWPMLHGRRGPWQAAWQGFPDGLQGSDTSRCMETWNPDFVIPLAAPPRCKNRGSCNGNALRCGIVRGAYQNTSERHQARFLDMLSSSVFGSLASAATSYLSPTSNACCANNAALMATARAGSR